MGLFGWVANSQPGSRKPPPGCLVACKQAEARPRKANLSPKPGSRRTQLAGVFSWPGPGQPSILVHVTSRSYGGVPHRPLRSDQPSSSIPLRSGQSSSSIPLLPRSPCHCRRPAQIRALLRSDRGSGFPSWCVCGGARRRKPSRGRGLRGGH